MLASSVTSSAMASTLRFSSRNFFARFLGFRCIASGEDDVDVLIRKLANGFESDAARCAGNEGYFLCHVNLLL